MHKLLGGFEFILRGGFMMYPLLAAALVALTAILERFYIFRSRYSTDPGLVYQLMEQVRKGEFAQAKTVCEQNKTPVTSVIACGLHHFENPPEEMELAMKNEAEHWIPRLEKKIDIIDTVITAAPLMGLLGTITGMMNSFKVLSEKGVNEPNAITGGVAEALIATATGLVIALVCLVAYNYLSGRIKVFIYDVESAASRLMEIRMAKERNKS